MMLNWSGGQQTWPNGDGFDVHPSIPCGGGESARRPESRREEGGGGMFREISGTGVLFVAFLLSMVLRVVGEAAWNQRRDDGSAVLHAAAELRRGEAAQVFHGRYRCLRWSSVT